MAQREKKGASGALTSTDLGPSPDLLDWLYGLVRDGLCVPLDGDRYRLRLTQAALARHMGLSPGSGTLSRRLRELSACGVVLSRRPLVFRLPLATRSATHPVPSTAGNSPALLAELTSLCAEAIRSRSDDVVLAALGCLEHALLGIALSAKPARDQRGFSSSIFSTDFSTDCADDPANIRPIGQPCDVARPDVAAVRSGRCSVPPGPLTGAVDDGRSVEVFRAIEPLVAICNRLGLPGVTNPRGLLHAVAAVGIDDLHCGARLIAQQLQANVPLRSPVGVLVALARRGELCGVAALERRAVSAPHPRETGPQHAGKTIDGSSRDAVDEHGDVLAVERDDPWWEELSRLERDDPSALCRLTGDTQPWLAKLRAYTRSLPGASGEDSGLPAQAADGGSHGSDAVPFPYEP